MEVVANADIADETRRSAAHQAHTALIAVHLTLQDDAGESRRVNELLQDLRVPRFDHAAAGWLAIRDSINAGKLPTD
jgi:hypothetical protein